MGFMQTDLLSFARHSAFANFPDATGLGKSFLAATYTNPAQQFLLRQWRGQWYRYDAGCYRLLGQDDLEVAMRRHVQAEYDAISARNHGAVPEITKALIANALDAVRAVVFVDTDTECPAWLDERAAVAKVLHVADQLVEVPSDQHSGDGRSYSHSPLYFSVNMLPGRLDPNLPDPPQFLAFLNQTFEGDKERVGFVQEWMGYLLLPDTSHQKMLIMLGEGRNGKSVLLEVIADMLGPRNVSNVPLDQLASRFGLGPTENKLVNICADVGNTRRIDEGALKQFVGGDMMQLEQKFRDPRSFRPTARVMASANNLPAFNDSSSGLWRRMLVLPFDRQVPESEVDRQLTRKLVSERDQVLLFALLGLLRLQTNGDFTRSGKMVAAATAYKRQSNPAHDFLTSAYQEDPASILMKDAIYQEYAEWSAKQGRPDKLNQAQFGVEVKRAFPNVTDARESIAPRRYQYKGLARRVSA